MQTSLDFGHNNTLYATHGLHAFAAKCPPQLVDYALENYSKPGELLLDPMVGSGTALVEARLKGRNALGYDLDPLARLIADVKCQIVDDGHIEWAANEVLHSAERDFAQIVEGRASVELQDRATPPKFHNRDYWFHPEVATALTLLAFHIHALKAEQTIRNFLWVAFSSLILARTSVANARDITHSRHHHLVHTETPDVFGRFETRTRRMRKQMAEFRRYYEKVEPKTTAEARLGDARELNLLDDSVDLVFTSPPYATALDYPRAHFLAIPWMQAVLKVDLATYRGSAPSYIGSQQGRLASSLEIDSRLAHLDRVTSVLTELNESSTKQAKLCHRYFVDMDKALGEIARVLRKDRHCVLVVCPSHIRKIDVPTHEMLIDIGMQHNLAITKTYLRTISERRRVMPYVSAFGKRMSTEYVLVFKKA